MFELGQDGVRKKSDMRFEISERSFEDEFQFKRVTQGRELTAEINVIIANYEIILQNEKTESLVRLYTQKIHPCIKLNPEKQCSERPTSWSRTVKSTRRKFTIPHPWWSVLPCCGKQSGIQRDRFEGLEELLFISNLGRYCATYCISITILVLRLLWLKISSKFRR